MEALACHPLGVAPFASGWRIKADGSADTIKVRMQLSRRARAPGVSRPSCRRAKPERQGANPDRQAKRRGFLTTGKEIVKRETPLGLYKGLGAVVTGIVPKMAIRFTSYEAYKQLLANKETGSVSGQATFFGTPPAPSLRP